MKIQRRPALYLALALITGTLGSYYLLNYNQLKILKLMILAEIIYLLYYTVFNFKKNKKSVYIWLTIFFLILGSILYAYQEYKYYSSYSCIDFAEKGLCQVLAEIKFDLGNLEGEQVLLKIHSINGKKIKYGKVIVASKQLKTFNYGDLVSLEMDLSKPTSALNPGGFSYLEYLKKKGVYLQGWKPHKISLIKQNKSLMNPIIKFKKTLLDNINQLFSEDKAAFIKAILLGEREYLSYEQQSLLRNAGASHLLAISGLHMGILILSISFVLFKICANKKTALCLLSFLTFLYIIMVGAAVSIIRAALLALLFLWSDQFDREGDFLNIISLTLIINLILDPLALFTVSLQLSYILVLALFYLTPLFNKFFPAYFAVSFSAQIASLAITGYYFNEYSFIALMTNLWAIPLITVLLPFILILVLLSLLSLNFFLPAALLAELGLEILFKGLKLMVLIQGKTLVIAQPELFTVILYYLFLFSLPYVYQKRYIYLKAKNFKIWQLIVPGLLILIISSFFLSPVSENLEIDYLAVGQGDGIFIQFPNGENMLIDTGPPGSEGRNVEYSIISYLNYLGIKTIDYLMISHFDADHAGGIPHLLQRKEIKTILIPPYKEPTALHSQLAAGSKKESQINFLTAGMAFKISGCQFKVLNPDSNKLSKNRNENSLVFLLKHQNSNFLFTGDLSEAGEEMIVKNYNLPKIDILKAGHHGSNTSSSKFLLEEIKPKLAVISVGRNNFGHPSKEVINRFDDLNIKYLRTDQRGMIKVISDGKKIYFDTFR
ncbi:competence protein ComEC [Halanaerobium saccharolyticum]|uniref:Competence protein ComEC n=1 Tax=Halanaerobium saccharolyticum TaxID=43595 RepID=A0A4V3CYM4_9FIRM|nr:DNA internalization-related competence protein ComEC/Rec2 [Halanaerobium saccharolyticum]TDP94708.1 competence protein ComEC [Halanaerobium saccharolyticum]